MCALNDTETGSSLVGRDLDKLDDLDDDVTTTAENVKFITSIVLETSQGQQIASVTQFTGPQLLAAGFSNGKVTGDVTGASEVKG